MQRIIEKNTSIEDHFIFLMERIVKRYRQIASDVLKIAGISVDEWIVLLRISENKGCSQMELSEFTSKGPAKMTRTIDLLLSKGLINKELDPEDRRRYMVFITAKGAELIQSLMPAVQNYRQQAIRGFTKEEQQLLTGLLKKTMQNLV